MKTWQTICFTGSLLALSSIAHAIPLPSEVGGKEYSQFIDRDASGSASPEQIVLWDGTGGVQDGANYFGTEPQVPSTVEIDAIAHHSDAYFAPLIEDNATLIFSVGNGTAPTGSGELTTDSGIVMGRAGDLSFESPVTGQTGIWATASEIDANHSPLDVDGVELWGRDAPGYDANRYSLVGDGNNGQFLNSGISVYCNTCGTPGNAYILQAGIRDHVAFLLGQPEDVGIESTEIDLDAMILGDTGGEDSIFVTGTDEIVFSIRQLEMPGKPGEFYATGSELFVQRADRSVEFLYHGGHLWDRDWALANMVSEGRQLDINALEAVSVPEPTTWLLASIALVIFSNRAKRHQ